MSLQVWLPLNGDLRNQGLTLLPDTSVNTFSYSNGKIGQCATGRVAWHLDNEILDNTWTVAMWVKPESLGTANNVLFCKNGTSSTDCHIYFSIISTTRLNLGVNGPSSSITASGQTFTTGTWYHVAATYDGTTATIYLNGVELKHGTVTTACPTGRLNMNINGRSTNAANTGTTGNITGSFNDFRLYDHCLSAAEIKEISQGLVLHYKLDSPYIESTTNLLTTAASYASPTALPVKHETSTSAAYNIGTITRSAGNNIVTYSAYITNVSNGYIYPRIRGLTADGSTWGSYANGNRIPAGESGWVQVSLDMTDASAYNGTSVYLRWQLGVARNAITENPIIQYAQLEVSDHRTPWILGGTSRNETNIEDSSGYNNNGSTLNTVSISSDTPRYSVSTNLPDANSKINCGRGGMVTDSITVNFWIKSSSWANPVSCTESGGWNFESDGDYFRFPVNITSVGYKYGKSTHTRAQICNNQWHMLTGVYDRINQKVQIYVDGILDNDYNAGTSNTIKYHASNVIWIGAEATSSATAANNGMAGLFSDFRIYCTALSADDILSLYNTSAKVDNKQNFHTFELVENNSVIKINKCGQTLCNELEENTATKFYKTNQIIETNEIIEL